MVPSAVTITKWNTDFILLHGSNLSNLFHPWWWHRVDRVVFWITKFASIICSKLRTLSGPWKYRPLDAFHFVKFSRLQELLGFLLACFQKSACRLFRVALN
jgi:hypothetical protein